MRYRDYYKALGDLLYAMAKVDGKIQKKEVEELYWIVQEELSKLEDRTDEFDTELAYTTEFEFEILQDQELSPDEAFLRFSEFLHENKNVPARLKKLAFRTARRIAEAYHGTNFQEQQMLEKLRNLLNEPVL